MEKITELRLNFPIKIKNPITLDRHSSSKTKSKMQNLNYCFIPITNFANFVFLLAGTFIVLNICF